MQSPGPETAVFACRTGHGAGTAGVLDMSYGGGRLFSSDPVNFVNLFMLSAAKLNNEGPR